MKKFLSLVLALVMTMSLVTISAGAKDFADDSKITYEEAVDVVSALKVVDGYADGSFNPNATLTRGAAAKIICNLILGPTTAGALSADVAPYKDVPANSTFGGYIAYCQKAGIISGYADGTFRPGNTLTGYAFMKMLLGALGYDKAAEGYEGANWSINVAKQAIGIGLDKGLEGEFNGIKPVTREEAALYAFNTLKATMVEYKNAGTITVGDITIKNNAVSSEVADTGNVYNTISTDGKLQFAEKYFSNLRLGTGADTIDGMKRPAHTWYVKNEKVGKYADDADYTFVVKKNKTAAKLIDDELGSAIDDTTAHAGNLVFMNGGAGNANTYALKVGDTVEVFMDATTPNKVTDIVVTRYTNAGKVTGAVATKGEGDDLEVRVPGVVSAYKDADLVVGYDGLEKDDVVYWYTNGDGVVTIAKADSFQGKLTTIKNTTPTKYVIDGADHVKNGTITVTDLSTPVFNTAYNYYTDNNGFVVFAEAVEEVLSDYVVVQELKYVGVGAGIGDTAHVEARLVKTDGSTEIVKVVSIDDGSNVYVGTVDDTDPTTANTAADAVKHGAGTGKYLVYQPSGYALNTAIDTETVQTMMFTYEVNSDGEYRLTKAAGTNIATGDKTTSSATTTYKASTGMLNGIAVNDDTIFVVKDLTASTLKFKTYTGKNSVPQFYSSSANDLKFAYVTNKGMATVVYVYAYNSATSTGDVLFILDGTPVSTTTVKKDDNSTYVYNTYDAVENGQLTQVKILSSQAVTTGTLYEPTYNADGIISSVSTTNTAARDTVATYGFRMTGTTLQTGKTYGSEAYANAYYVKADTIVIIKDEDDNYTQTVGSELSADANDVIDVALTSTTANMEAYIVFVTEKDADVSGISFTVGTHTLTDTDKTATIEGVASTAYTEYKTGASAVTEASITLVLNPEAGCKVEYNKADALTNATWGTWTDAATTAPSAITADATYNIKVTAEDTSVSYYQVIIDFD